MSKNQIAVLGQINYKGGVMRYGIKEIRRGMILTLFTLQIFSCGKAGFNSEQTDISSANPDQGRGAKDDEAPLISESERGVPGIDAGRLLAQNDSPVSIIYERVSASGESVIFTPDPLAGGSGFKARNLFFVFKQKIPGSREIFSCVQKSAPNLNFPSADPNCEGETKESSLGFLLTSSQAELSVNENVSSKYYAIKRRSFSKYGSVPQTITTGFSSRSIKVGGSYIYQDPDDETVLGYSSTTYSSNPDALSLYLRGYAKYTTTTDGAGNSVQTYTGSRLTGTVYSGAQDYTKDGKIYVWVIGTGGKRWFMGKTGEWVVEEPGVAPNFVYEGKMKANHYILLSENLDLTPYVGLSIFIGYGTGADPYSEMMTNKRYISRVIKLDFY